LASHAHDVRDSIHMMMDLNNLQVADWLVSWVKKNLPKKAVAMSRSKICY